VFGNRFRLASPLLNGSSTRGDLEMNKSAVGFLMMGFALLGGCASGSAEQRGSVVMAPDSVKALASGPAILRAYSMDSGGRVFVVRANTGTDADCVGAAERSTNTSVVAVDRRNVVELSSGQVACVAASRSNYELLWRARPAEEPIGTLVAAGRR
jgi:hypothetical protein